MELALRAITLDEELRIRPLHPDVVDHYADILSELPPVTVFAVGEDYLLASGWHRFAAAQQLEWEAIPVDIRHGTREDALIFALTANTKHGLPLSAEEEHQAVLRLATLFDFKFDGGRIQPYGLAERIARAIGRSERTVLTLLRSSLVRQAVPLAAGLPAIFTQTKLEAISRAPQETWPALTNGLYQSGGFKNGQLEPRWDLDETQRRVRDLNAGKPLEEVIDRPIPRYIPPEQPTPDPEHDNLEDYMELSRAIGRFAPYLSVGRYDWRDVPRDEGGVMLMQLGMMRAQIERIMAFLLGQGYEPQTPSDEPNHVYIEV